MPRDYRVYLDDILEAVRKIHTYTAGMTRESLQADTKTLDAVIRNLEVIGEAVKNIPEDLRSQHPHVEWQKIAGLRDVLSHAYFRVNVDIVYDVVTNKLPSLEDQVRKILEETA